MCVRPPWPSRALRAPYSLARARLWPSRWDGSGPRSWTDPDAELATGTRVVHRGRRAHPAVYTAGEMLRRVHGGRVIQPERQVQGVRPDTSFVPPASRDEVHLFCLAPHDRAAVRPQNAGGGIGDRHDQLTVVRRRLQLGFELPHGGAERARLEGVPRFVERRPGAPRATSGMMCAAERSQLATISVRTPAPSALQGPLVAYGWNVQIPRPREMRASAVQLRASGHDLPQGPGGARQWGRGHAALGYRQREYEVRGKGPEQDGLRSCRFTPDARGASARPGAVAPDAAVGAELPRHDAERFRWETPVTSP